MKHKGMTSILVIAVIAVWGLIIYRVLQSAGGDDAQPFQTTPNIKKEVFNDYAMPQDTTHLLLNYRDPFSPKKTDTAARPFNRVSVPVKSSLVPAKPLVNWSFITYTGYLGKPGSKRIMTMMSVNGREVMMAEGEITEQVKLLKNMKDSVKILYQGKTKFITMNSKNQ
ncbi:hypothetical protein ACFGVR_15445 [Mucilaginibacter sp. AW1-3]